MTFPQLCGLFAICAVIGGGLVFALGSMMVGSDADDMSEAFEREMRSSLEDTMPRSPSNP